VASLAGGALNLARRGEAVAADGDLRLACHLVELAGLAAPEEHAVQAIRAQVYEQRRLAETSLMAKGVYASAVRESQAVLGAG
jgi:alkyl sulfatase BDS1-like metallo-beta-lactamase superfamily hydrolase